MIAFGVDEWTARLPAAMAGWLAVLVVGFTGAWLAGPASGVFAALVLLGTVLAVPGELFQLVAFAVLPARVLQSTVHIASGRNRAVLARFAFFSIQLCCFALLIVLLAAHGLRMA